MSPNVPEQLVRVTMLHVAEELRVAIREATRETLAGAELGKTDLPRETAEAVADDILSLARQGRWDISAQIRGSVLVIGHRGEQEDPFRSLGYQ
ncbi:MAG: hypothetical protein V1908_01820 [Candidatus Peregrinibacteria bacterium]